MLGFVDLLRAVRGTVTLFLRRLEGPVGLALLVAVGVLTVGIVAWGVGGGGGSTEGAAPSVRTYDETDPESDSSVTETDGGDRGSSDGGAAAPDADASAPGDPTDGPTTSGPSAVPDDQDDSGGSFTPPSGVGVGTTTVPPSSTTPSSTAPSTTTTTTTTAPPGGVGNLLDRLNDIFGLIG